jgi:Response regulators consisting of a CheY-like receiver domain and a winged-helix DNA-binding domain
MKGHILIVDDEPAIRFFLSETLSQAVYEVTTAASGEQALALLQQQPIDLVLLDLKMEGIDGLQVMAEVERLPLPPVVIILTAHASLDSAIQAMRRGGHDYLIKPCRTEELLASVEKGLARRQKLLQQQALLHQIEVSARQLRLGSLPDPPATPGKPRFLEARGLLLDREQHTVTRQGQPIHLTPSEFKLLLCLMEQADHIVPLDELMRVLHGTEGDRWEARRAISTHLWNLRRKIGNAPDGGPYLVNVRGRGYRFVKSRATASSCPTENDQETGTLS